MTVHYGARTNNGSGWESGWDGEGRPNLPSSPGNTYILGVHNTTVNKGSTTTIGSGNLLENRWRAYGFAGTNCGWRGPLENYARVGVTNGTFTYESGRMRNWAGADINLTSNGNFANNSLVELIDGASITGGSGRFFTNNYWLDIFNGNSSCAGRLVNNANVRLRSGTGTFTLSGATSTQDPNGLFIINNGRTFTLNARFDNSGEIRINSGGTLNGTGTIANNRILRNLGGGLIAVYGTFNRNGPLRNLTSGGADGIINVLGGNMTFPNTESYLVNRGYIRIRNGSTVAFPTVAYTNTGTIEISDSVASISGNINGTSSAVLSFGVPRACTGTTAATISVPAMYIYNSGTNVGFNGVVTASDLLEIAGGSATFNNNIVLGNELRVNSDCTFNQTSGSVTSSGTVNVTNSGTFTHSGADFAPTYFTNYNSATFSGTNYNPTLTANYANLTINGTTAINGNIINYTDGALTLGGTSHSIAAGVTITHNSTGANKNFEIDADTTLNSTSTIRVNSSLFIVRATLTNGEIENNAFARLRANVDGTGTFTNTATVDQVIGNVSKAVVNQGTWILSTGSAPELSSTNFENATSDAILRVQPSTTLSGTVTNHGRVIFSDGGSSFTGTINAQTGSRITVQAPMAASLGTITGAVGNTDTVLFINTVSAGSTPVSTGAAISDIRSIRIDKGTFNIGHNVTGVSDQFIVNASDVNVNVTAALSGGSGNVVNRGTLNFNAGSSLSNFDYLYKYAGSTTTFNTAGTFSINGTDIIGVPSTGAGTLSVTAATTLQTNAAINGVQTINVIGNSRLTLQSGASCTNFTNINLASGSTIQIDSGAALTVSDSRTLSGDGDIVNSGFFEVDNSNLTLGTGGVGGNFTNNSSGIFYINGTPTITFAGATFVNSGSILASFSTQNTLPHINLANVQAAGVSLSNGTIVVGYNNNYIAEGQYTLLTSNDILTPSTLGGYVLPQPSRYISSWSLSTDGANANVQVVRDGFGNHATTARGKAIGDYMESIGSSNPTQAQLDLLNALEKIDDDGELNTALVNLFPPESPPLQTMQMISTNLRQVEIRLVNTRQDTIMAAAGDNDLYGKHGVWIRPFTSSGHQRDKQDLLGYKAKTKGIAFGIDTEAQNWLTVGIAGSVSKSTVTQNNNSLTYTDISAYQAMVYGTVKSANDAYFDWILAVGNNNYDGVRNVSLPGFEANAVSDYGGQQITAKVIASRDFELFNYYQLTPHGSAQYSFLRTLAYQENGAGAFNVSVSPNNMNLFRMGLGAELSVPLSDRNYVGIPAIHAGAYVDAGGGAQDTNSMFISGGPIISSKLQPNRLLIKVGASFNLSINDNVELTANYDLESRRGYTGHEAYLNLRYIF